MKEGQENPYEALEKLFHEPNRLAIMSALCAEGRGLTFTELKAKCSLTDGNLNRHLKALDDAGAIRIEKRFVDAKPRTTVFISDEGIKRFNEYLNALANVLENARQAMPEDAIRKAAAPVGEIQMGGAVAAVSPSPAYSYGGGDLEMGMD
ncbi:MAG: transcriptional regulator [Kiritimatiellia bacterium]|jgi:DNA-binding transcriptional ArsR family regulator|nr:transcriptional regulator [Kiritimatiellia bacterium]